MWCSKNLYIFFVLTLIHFINAASEEVTEFSGQISQFAQDFSLNCLRSEKGNVIVSPLSVSTALTLLLQATDGSTFDQLHDALHLKNNKIDVANHYSDYLKLLQNNVGDATLLMANQIYIHDDYQLNEQFQDVATTQFQSIVESLNFTDSVKSADIINQSVDKKTNHRIKDLVEPDAFDSDTRVFLVNAIYFKGQWEQPFDTNKTFTGDFYINETETVPVDYMNVKDYFYHTMITDLDAHALELKYANSNMSLITVLPNNRTGLSELESKLQEFNLASITSNMYSEEIDVTIPKFTIEFQSNLNDVLKNLGMGEMFTENANLKGLLNTTEPIAVSDVVHKAFIEINEEGSEAAAATGIKAVFYAASLDIDFRADHPFLFFIREIQSNSIVFSGRYQPN